MKESNLSYNTINTAKSAIVSQSNLFNSNDLGNHLLIKKFMRGIFNIRPSLPKYNCTWDVETVLKYLKYLHPLEKLSLLDLSRKLVMLLALTTGQRLQTLFLLDIRNITCDEDFVKLRIGDLLKQSKPNNHLSEIYIKSYPDHKICVVKTLKSYIQRTDNLRTESCLFIRTQKPHFRVSKDTLSRWIKYVLKAAGIDIALFSAHSTRSASCSAVSNIVPVNTILKTAGWKKENTFRKFYKLNVTNDSSFSTSVISASETV